MLEHGVPWRRIQAAGGGERVGRTTDEHVVDLQASHPAANEGGTECSTACSSCYLLVLSAPPRRMLSGLTLRLLTPDTSLIHCRARWRARWREEMYRTKPGGDGDQAGESRQLQAKVAIGATLGRSGPPPDLFPTRRRQPHTPPLERPEGGCHLLWAVAHSSRCGGSQLGGAAPANCLLCHNYSCGAD